MPESTRPKTVKPPLFAPPRIFGEVEKPLARAGVRRESGLRQRDRAAHVRPLVAKFIVHFGADWDVRGGRAGKIEAAALDDVDACAGRRSEIGRAMDNRVVVIALRVLVVHVGDEVLHRQRRFVVEEFDDDFARLQARGVRVDVHVREFDACGAAGARIDQIAEVDRRAGLA